MKITFISFEFSSPASTPSDYRDLSPLILFESLKKAGTKLLWPISEFRLSVPSAVMGRAISDLQRMKATLDEPVMEGDQCLLTGLIPVELSHNYELTVRQYTAGMGHYESKVIGYEDAPEELYKERPRFKLDPANRGEYLLAKLRAT
jgi:ribosomal protection tetracycline resistance protein